MAGSGETKERHAMRTKLDYLVICVAATGLLGLASQSVAAEKYPKAEHGVIIMRHIPDQVVPIDKVATFIVAAESDEPSNEPSDGTNAPNDLVFRWHRN